MPDYGVEFEADFREYGFDYRWRPGRVRGGAPHGPFGWEAAPEPRWFTDDEREYLGDRPRWSGRERAGFGHPEPRPWRPGTTAHGPGVGRGVAYNAEYWDEGYGRYGGPPGDELGYGAGRDYEYELGPRGWERPRERRPRKSRRQTYHGDPFGDRELGTPIRMITGEWSRYDEDYNRGRGAHGRQRPGIRRR